MSGLGLGRTPICEYRMVECPVFGECEVSLLALSELCVSLFWTTRDELGEPKKAARAMYQ